MGNLCCSKLLAGAVRRRAPAAAGILEVLVGDSHWRQAVPEGLHPVEE